MQLTLGLLTITVSLQHLGGHEMTKFMAWAQGIVTLQPQSAAYVADANPLFKVHMLLGMTIFLVVPFTRLVHVWSAPVWYLGRSGYQIVRTRRPLSHGAARPEAARSQRPSLPCRLTTSNARAPCMSFSSPIGSAGSRS